MLMVNDDWYPCYFVAIGLVKFPIFQTHLASSTDRVFNADQITAAGVYCTLVHHWCINIAGISWYL